MTNIRCLTVPWTVIMEKHKNIFIILFFFYHFYNGLSEGSSLDVFRDKVYSFVFIKQSNEL